MTSSRMQEAFNSFCFETEFCDERNKSKKMKLTKRWHSYSTTFNFFLKYQSWLFVWGKFFVINVYCLGYCGSLGNFESS
jgi:hypothetical protein